jgi:predicted MFS family arabinose efflux permease
MVRTAIRRYRDAYSGLPREVWLLALVMFVNRSGSMVLPFLTLYLTSELGMKEAAAGRMVSVYGLGAVCGAYGGGRLVSAFGAVRVQTVGMFLSVPGFLFLPLWRSAAAMGVSLFCLSLACEAIRPANAAGVTQFTTTANRTRAFALQRLAANLGFSFGPAIGGVLATIDFVLLFWVDAATSLAAACVLLWFFRMRRVETPSGGSGAAPLAASPLRDREFVVYLLLILGSMIVFFQFGSTYPLYLRDHYRLSKPLIGLMWAVNTSVIVVCEMLLVDAIKHWPLLRTIGWGCFLSCAGFGILPFGSSLGYCVLAMLVLTVGEMLSMSLSAGYVANRAAPGSEGAYMGWYMVILALSAVLGPGIGSAIYEVNREAVWLTAFSVGAAVLVGFLALDRSTDAKPQAAREGPGAARPLDDVGDGRLESTDGVACGG